MPGEPLSTICHPMLNYSCSGVIYSHTTGNVTLIIGQATGVNWTSTIVYFVPHGVQNVNGTPITVINGISGNTLITGMPTGTTTQITLGVSSHAYTTEGTEALGSLWAKYWTANGGPYYVEIATIKTTAI